ncbi:hypothetical protein [Actinoplanes utahensis]|uniref:hypothetical protein n=1 Tax=Actinoplanes utahensis TaxID=1869 RepID=UPI00068AD553|nr:hypothetical protein [Actinoplanes utahensis]
MRHRIAALAGAVIAGAVLNTAIGATPASADVRGFSVRVTAPDDFTPGAAAKTVTAVVTSENRRCRKVRFALLLRSRVDPEQVRVTRVEDDGPFDTTSTTEGTTTTIVDDALDPGLSCRGRTVTGRWQVAFAGPDGGDVQFEVRAFDEQDTLLTAAGAAAGVEGAAGEESSPTPSPPPTSRRLRPRRRRRRRASRPARRTSPRRPTPTPRPRSSPTTCRCSGPV